MYRIPSDSLIEKVKDTLQMCEVEFEESADKKSWDAKNVGIPLDMLLKDQFAFKIEESAMDLALGALNAGI